MFVLIFLCMLFCHVVDDYYLQGILAKMKQKSWWQEQTNKTMYEKDWIPGLKKMYEKDWIPALIAHGISWSFMIMLPCNVYFMIYNPDKIYLFAIMFVLNAIAHCFIDDAKCNRHKINLITDQCLHILQIGITFICFLIVCLI